MVHALKDIGRVLISGGYLIDLRPLTEKLPVEIVVGDEILPAGFIDAGPAKPDDTAANNAVEHMVVAGLFNREQSDSFDLYIYWDAADEFKTFWENNTSTILPPETSARVEQILSQVDSDAHIRTQANMIIARYRKLHSH